MRKQLLLLKFHCDGENLRSGFDVEMTELDKLTKLCTYYNKWHTSFKKDSKKDFAVGIPH